MISSILSVRVPSALAISTLILGLAACKTPEPDGSGEEIGMDEFRDLIEQGSLRPVSALEGEDSFDAQAGELSGQEDSLDVAERKLLESGTLQEGRVDDFLTLPENPYLTFGKRIVVHESGLITKPYPLRVGTGEKLQQLILSYAGLPIWNPETVQGPDSVRLELLKEWDIELYTNLRAQDVKEMQPTSVSLADWLVVTASAEWLSEVESFINVFAAGVPQIEIEAKIVEVTASDSLDIGVKQIDETTPIFDFPDGTLVDTFTFNLPNTGTDEALLALGSVTDDVVFNALLEAVATYENVSIISRPKIAVREGGQAEVVALEEIPFFTIQGIDAAGNFGAALTYKEVGIKLYVVPRVVGTDTVALNIDIEASQESGSSVTFTIGSGLNSSELSNPIITSRSARTTVYLQPGQAVILGGLITERMVDRESKVPILGDIPILGLFFRSTFTAKQQSNVLFFIRPRILQGSDLHRDF